MCKSKKMTGENIHLNWLSMELIKSECGLAFLINELKRLQEKRVSRYENKHEWLDGASEYQWRNKDVMMKFKRARRELKNRMRRARLYGGIWWQISTERV